MFSGDDICHVRFGEVCYIKQVICCVGRFTDKVRILVAQCPIRKKSKIFCPPFSVSFVIGIEILKFIKMKEFVLIFRNSADPHTNPSPEQIRERMNWLGSIAAQNKLADKGNRLSADEAKTVKPDNVITDGPYTEIKEFISGFMIVKTGSIEEAVELAKSNPILKAGGNVEVRAVLSTPDK